MKTSGGQLKEILTMFCPKSLKQQIKLARDYARGDCDIIQAIVERKVDFYSAGFDVQVETGNKNNKGALNQRVDTFIYENKIPKIVQELFTDRAATDNCILTWKADGQICEYVMTLDPSRVDFDNTLGNEVLSVEMDPDTVKAIRNMLQDGKNGYEKAVAAFPEKFVVAVKKGDRFVKLSNEDGEYWIVRTTNRRFSGLARPSMYSIFSDVLLRDTLVSGDWAVAYFIKRMIEVIKSGESPPNGKLNNLRELYPTKPEIQALQAQFQKIGQVMRLYTNHTVKVEYAHPDPKVFDPLKYEKVEERIHRWGGVPSVLMVGSGSDGYSQGHIGVQAFFAQGQRMRGEIGEMIEEFFTHESIRSLLGLPTATTAKCLWNEQILKDPKQVLAETTAAWDRGLIDNRTFLERHGMWNDMIPGRKEQDLKDKEKWVPTFEPKQGLLSEDAETGRPSSGKPKAAPDSRRRPSRGE